MNRKGSRPNRKRSLFLFNTLFLIGCCVVLLFLFLAPEETTSRLPHDEIHSEFHEIKSKKEAGKTCVTCHNVEGEFPLPEGHPAPFRCLFCHKRDA